MANLFFRSFLVLGALFGLLFAVLMAVLFAMELPAAQALPLGIGIAVAISLLQFAISPYIIQWILKINWVEPEMVSPKLGSKLREMCLQRRLKVPRFGIIEDGSPNAFTFGHFPGDARLVLTRGLVEICDEDETEAVMAHELGHIIHWDFVVMTVAATIPLILYVIYRFGIRAGRGRGKNAGAIVAVAIGAFIAYIISEYIVLFLSRVREYYADQFAAQTTRNPNALSTALVKIAYGLARAEPAVAANQEQRRQSAVAAGGTKMMGIFDPRYGGSMAMAAAGGYQASTHSYDRETTLRTMRWDLWNPWAMIAELSSSHPLPAKRLQHLDQIARQMGQRALYDISDRQPESYWDDFATDLFYNYLPILGLLAGAGTAVGLAGMAEEVWLLAAGLAVGGWAFGNLIRLSFAYPKRDFPSEQVANLVGEVKVSHIRCRPVTLRGKIIGRGIPGLYWSEDLVVHDGTGFMLMDYRQPLRLLEVLFGLFRADQFIGQQVIAQGWYRRYPIPVLELYKVQLPDGSIHTSHNWAMKFWGTIVALAAAGFGVLVGLGMVLAA